MVQRCARRSAQCEAEKGRASQKQRSDFFGGPGSHGPSGQAKERTRILPVRMGFLCSVCRAACRGGRFCETSRCCGGFCARLSHPFCCCEFFCRRSVCGKFDTAVWTAAPRVQGSAAVPAALPRPAGRLRFCSRPACRLPLLCLACAARAVCRKCAVCFLARIFLLSFCPFLPNFFLSNLFSFVAQAATGLYFLPKRK